MVNLVHTWRRLSLHPWMRPLTEWRILRQWDLAGRPIPATPIIKQTLIKDYQRRFNLRVFVETGTFAGEMIDAVLGRFDRIFSIELDQGWYEKAVKRFADRPEVTLLHGDSGTRLPDVLRQVKEPALFWLDAHYSGPVTARGALDSPIVQELEAIAAHPVRGHVVLIDDMRDFDGTGGYPEVSALVDHLRAARPAAVVDVRDDVLRWHP
jgi:hypothetical protein